MSNSALRCKCRHYRSRLRWRSTLDHRIAYPRHRRSDLRASTELHGENGAGHRFTAGAGEESRVTVAYGTPAQPCRSRCRKFFPRPVTSRLKASPRPVLQNRSRRRTESQRHRDAYSRRLEGQRLGDLYVGRSNATGLHGRCAHRCEFGPDGLRNCHRAVSNPASAQFECRERTFEGWSLDAKPHRYDRFQIASAGWAKARSAVPTLSNSARRGRNPRELRLRSPTLYRHGRACSWALWFNT